MSLHILLAPCNLHWLLISPINCGLALCNQQRVSCCAAKRGRLSFEPWNGVSEPVALTWCDTGMQWTCVWPADMGSLCKLSAGLLQCIYLCRVFITKIYKIMKKRFSSVYFKRDYNMQNVVTNLPSKMLEG